MLVPATVTLEGMKITDAFIETHLITTNPLKTSQFASVNGVRGRFSSLRDSLTVLTPPEVPTIFVVRPDLWRDGVTLN